jgi:hypothetical protein
MRKENTLMVVKNDSLGFIILLGARYFAKLEYGTALKVGTEASTLITIYLEKMEWQDRNKYF